MTYRERRTDLDALRGFAILYVVGFHHLSGYSPALSGRNPATLLLTFCILGLFTFLSGYLNSRRYDFKEIREVLTYYKRRFVRIYPLYLVALTGFFVVGFIDVQSYVKSALLLNMLLNAPLLTLWFITMIAVLNVLLPIFVYRFSVARAVTLAGVLWGVLVVVHCVTGRVDLRLPQYLVAFVAGITVARSPAFEVRLRNPCVAGMCVPVLAAMIVPLIRTQDALRVVVIDITILASIPVFLLLGEFLAKWMPRKILVFVSYASFVTYLLHRITFHFGVRLYQPTGLSSSVLYLWCILLPATILASYAIQKLYDRVLDTMLLSNKHVDTDKQ
ncbi:MAG: acyltransferase family protein [Planctomycetota bacterium]|jgi:peptidoglycan/LPS O-acetylase OafA/YrhL